MQLISLLAGDSGTRGSWRT